jgi:hypothetical protein
MKPFDLEAAKSGDPVYMDARYTGWNYVGPVYFVGVSENGLPVVEIGAKPTRVSPEYLRMAPKKRTVWINPYRRGSRTEAAWHDAESIAHLMTEGCEDLLVARAVAIEIED